MRLMSAKQNLNWTKKAGGKHLILHGLRCDFNSSLKLQN